MFYIEQNSQIVLFDEYKKKLERTVEKFMPQYKGLEIKTTSRPIIDYQFADTPEYQEEQAQKEAARIAMLNLTAADVERAIYKAKGIDFEDVITQLEAIPLAEGQAPVVDIKALKIELKANNFYRGNPYIDTVGTLLGFTKEQLDKFFVAANTDDGKADAYKYLTAVTLTINPTPADATVTINGTIQSTITLPYGAPVEYAVSKDGYLSAEGGRALTKNTTLDIVLEEESEIEPDRETQDTTTEEVEG